MYQPVPRDLDFPSIERRQLAFWDETRAFETLKGQLESSEKRFSFIDGPITANNPMGVHHAWGRAYKDIFQRYRAMTGHRQRFQNGFDCQGLWVEVEVEKELGFKSKRDIEDFGIAEFVQRCKDRVLNYARLQSEQSVRMGYWMDWSNSYYTMSDENNYTIWKVLKTCHERGWLYRGHDVMPWCPRCGTGISQHEIDTEGYQDVTHTSLYVRFPLLEREGESLVVWTTTPWTLTSNVAAAVHPELAYIRARKGNETLILAESQASILGEGWEVVEMIPGEALIGLRYRGPFDELPAQQGVEHRVIPWSEVSQEEGTGIVHIAPGCGQEDYALAKQLGLPAIAPLDDAGVYLDGFGWLTGRQVGSVATEVATDLEGKGLLFRAQPYRHRYPHCWRCRTELVFRLVDEWYISMDEPRSSLMDVTRQVRWIPEFGLERELDWLQNMHDWMISKKRYWGLALPIWVCDACSRFEVIGDREELRNRAVAGWDEFEGHSPHRPWIDAVKVACSECGASISRIADVGNPWLDAGIVAYSTLGYTSNPELWREWFPSDFITESFPGQYRNWFYAMLVMSTVLEGTTPFRTVLGFGTLRDEAGRPMHKSLGNSPDFNETVDTVGADVLRWIFSQTNPAVNLNYGTRLTEETKRTLLTLWNSYSFFVTYARLEAWTPASGAPPPSERPYLDRWLLARLQQLIRLVRDRLEEYDAMNASRGIQAFFEDLSNWYIRRARARFWAPGGTADPAALATLHHTLVTVAELMAPFMPFLAEELYQNLVRNVDPDAAGSVHLRPFPREDPALHDATLVELMELVRQMASLGHAARKGARVPVRRPLPAIKVAANGLIRDLPDALLGELADELNVKKVEVGADLSGAVRHHAEPNPKLLGPRYGKDYPAIRQALQAGQFTVDSEGRVRVLDITLAPDEATVSLQPAPGYAAAVDGGVLVVLDTAQTPELVAEGRAREWVRLIQDARKRAGLDVADRIVVAYQAPPDLAAALSGHSEIVQRETLARELVERPGGTLPDDGYLAQGEIDGLPLTLAVRRVQAND